MPREGLQPEAQRLLLQGRGQPRHGVAQGPGAPLPLLMGLAQGPQQRQPMRAGLRPEQLEQPYARRQQQLLPVGPAQ